MQPPTTASANASPRTARVPAALLASWLLALGVSGCVLLFRKTEVAEITATAQPVGIVTPVKAHMVDGSTAVFRNGAVVGPDSVQGTGVRFTVDLRDSAAVRSIPVDSVVGLETFRTVTDGARSRNVSLGVSGAIVGAIAVYCATNPKACFGSCPTFYSLDEGTALLEAEGFSYSIAPLLEGRDVDRLSGGARRGVLELDVRNEALETHHLNHLELLEVTHAADEVVLPDARGATYGAAALVEPVSARDLDGRDVRAPLAASDGRAFESTRDRLRRASVTDWNDAIELVFARPAAAGDSVGIVLRLRNSLLNTVLLYDFMLGGAGARALDWLGDDLANIGRSVELGRWYSGRFGLRIAVWDGVAYRDAGRIPDTGPIAWKDVIVPVALPASDSVRVRLTFVTDGWRLDRVALAARVRPLDARTVPLASVLDADGAPAPDALRALGTPDEEYLETRPGQRFTARFVTGADSAPRTFLLASQGWYTEWIRRAWIQRPRSAQPFTPSDTVLVAAIREWAAARDSMETVFRATRIPVR